MFKKLTYLALFFSSYGHAEDSVTYQHISQLFPGQVRYSSQNVKQKVDQAIKKHDAIWNTELHCYEGRYFEGKSLFPKEEALPVLQAPFGLILADGHHHTLAALSLGIEWVPIKILADLSHLSSEKFWSVAEEKGWAFLYDLEGNRMTPMQDFSTLIDDPNRYFAAITARKCPANGDMSASIGAEYPLWIKVGKDIPFIEFRISDALRKAGIEYTYVMGDEPPIDFVEQARQALFEANIPGLRVIPERTHFSQINRVE